MPLRRLAALERKKIETEYKTIQATIKRLQSLLRSPKKIREVVAEELENVKTTYGDPRRTQIVRLGEGETRATVLTASDLTPDETIWVAVSPEGMVSRTTDKKPPRLSGSAAPGWLVKANTRDTLYLVNEVGEAAALAIHVLPEAGGADGDVHFSRLSPLTDRDPLAAVFSLPSKDQLAAEWHVVSVSRSGMIKKSALEELPGPSARTFTLVKINEDDRLGWLRLSDGSADVLLATSDGMAIRFSEEEVRPMGLVATGVMAIKLKNGEEVIGFDLVPNHGEVFLQRSDGHAKRVALDQFPRQGRYGQGVIAWKITAKTKLVGMTIGKGTAKAILHLQMLTAKAIRLDSAPLRTRPSQGAQVVELKTGDRVISLTSPWEPPRPQGGKQKASSRGKGKTRKT
jgi:DNA gyrase subunit A